MKLILSFLLIFGFSINAKCISKEEARQVINQMEILVEEFSRTDLIDNLKEVSAGYMSVVRGESKPECEFEGQCVSDFHHTLKRGALRVFINCSGKSRYYFVNDVVHD